MDRTTRPRAESPRVSRAAFGLALFAILSSAFGCSLDTTTDVRFAFMPGEVPAFNSAGFDNKAPAPLSPPGGVVYLRALKITRGGTDGELSLGPFPVAPGLPFVPEGLEPGNYRYVALYYAPAAIDPAVVANLPLPGEDRAAFWDTAAAPAVSRDILDDSGAVALFADLKIRRFRPNHLEAALVPLTSERFAAADGVQPPCPDTGGAVRKRFIRLDPSSAGSLYVMLTNFDGAGITYAGTVSLYTASGGCVETKNLNRPITPDSPESILFTMTGDESLYLYVEYVAAGNRPLGLFFF